MEIPNCPRCGAAAKKHGSDKNRNPRYMCLSCGRTFGPARPTGGWPRPANTGNEQWLPIPSTQGHYDASSHGRIRRVWRHRCKVLVATVSGGTERYPDVLISINGEIKHKLVHILVAEAFHGPRPMGLEINHIDGNKRNSRPDNLEYVTKSYNQLDTLTRPNRRAGEGHPRSKLKISQVHQIRKLAANGDSTLTEIARQFNVTPQAITSVVRRRTWKCV